MENSRDKQIEEMRRLADEMGKAISTEYEKRVLADERKLEEVLKANGWRKASDLAEEIFDDIERLMFANRFFTLEGAYYHKELKDCIAELKNKYTESENNNE